MGLRTSQFIGTMMDGAARHTPEGIAWRDLAMKEGFREAVRRRDAPFGDYGERRRTENLGPRTWDLGSLKHDDA